MTSENNLDDLWATQLADLPPKTVLNALRTNLSSHSTLTNTLSEFLSARATVEQEYVKSLNKLVGKFGGQDIARAVGSGGGGIGGGGAGGAGSLGELKGTGPGAVWERVVGETVDTAQAHSSLAQTIATAFADPLRTLPTKIPAWNRISTLDGNVDRTLKSYETSLKALEKAEKKGKSAKTIAAQSEVNSASQSLAIELPGLCRDYQNLQSAQSKYLKEFLIRWETARADAGNEIAKRAERGMEVALGWEVEDDLRKGLSRLGGKSGPGGSGASVRGTPSRAPSIRRPTMDSQYRPSAERQPLPDRTNSHNTQSDFNAGLPPPISSSVSTMSSSTGFGSNNNNGGGGGLPSTSSSLTSAFKSKFTRKSSMIVPSGSSRLDGFGSSNSGRDTGNGYRDRSASDASTLRNGAVGARITGGGPASRPNGTGYEGSGDGQEVLAGGRGSGGPSSAPVDSEGFSVRPQDAEQAPWERPSNGHGPRDLLGEDDDDGTDSVSALATPSINSGQPKLNLALAPLPIQETDAERQAALDKMQSTLLTRPPSAPKRQSTIARGRRDVRNTTFNTLPDDMPLAQAMRERGIEQDNGPIPGTPERKPSALAPLRTGFTDSPVASSPIGSMTNFASPPPTNRQDSAVSTGSGSNPFDARPAANSGSGLRASITESVNIVTRGGLVQKAMITGEVTLSLRDVDGRANDTTVHIKLNEFEQLEKVAPNPKFLAQYPDRPGEYYLNLETLAQATASSNSQPILFKYQLHIPEGKAGDYAPIEMNPQWKTMEGETRLVLNYKANTDGHLGRQLLQTAASVDFDGTHRRTVTDVSFLAGLGGPSVTNVQAKPPGGTWSPERRKMLWKVDDLDFDASSASSAGKIVARFLTEGVEPGVPEGVVVRWRCEGTLTSGLGIVVVEDDSSEGWRFEEVRKAVMSGKYMAE